MALWKSKRKVLPLPSFLLSHKIPQEATLFSFLVQRRLSGWEKHFQDHVQAGVDTSLKISFMILFLKPQRGG